MRYIRFVILLLSISASSSWAVERVSGQLVASDACPAYQSFRKQTNPGDVYLVPGASYEVVERNSNSNPVSVRLRIKGADPVKRWVAQSCGDVSITAANNECQIPGLADSYVLALSWQPAFCEMISDKPECAVRDPDSFQANHFTLHGLWPNKASCGVDYGMCDPSITKQTEFCDYPALKLTPESRSALESVMPSAKHGSCLQRHEWYKHGTCQKTMDVGEYYQTSVRMTNEFNTSGMAAFMSSRIGQVVQTQDFLAAFDNAFGKNRHNALTLKCFEDKLMDVYVELTLPVDAESSLSNQIQYRHRTLENKCGRSFLIDSIDD